MQNLLNKTFNSFIALLMVYTFLPAFNNQSNAESDSAPKTEATTPVPLVFDKLIGTWLLEDGKTFEQWTKNADGTYQSIVCLLYTSPSPRDGLLSRMPSSA